MKRLIRWIQDCLIRRKSKEYWLVYQDGWKSFSKREDAVNFAHVHNMGVMRGLWCEKDGHWLYQSDCSREDVYSQCEDTKIKTTVFPKGEDMYHKHEGIPETIPPCAESGR